MIIKGVSMPLVELLLIVQLVAVTWLWVIIKKLQNRFF